MCFDRMLQSAANAQKNSFGLRVGGQNLKLNFVILSLIFFGSWDPPNTVPGSTTSPPTECTISMDRWGVGLAAHLPQVAIFFVENHLKQQNHTRRRSPLYSWYHECYFYSKSRNRYQVLLQNCFLQSFLIKLAPVLILAAEITAMSRSPA